MAVTSHLYPMLQQHLAQKQINLASDTLKAMLLASYTPSATHSTMADVLGAASEASGTGYTAGGATLTGVSLSTSGSVTTLSCANPTWPSSTITAAFAVIYDAQGGTNATNFPLCYYDFGGNQADAAGTLTIGMNALGLLQWTSSF